MPGPTPTLGSRGRGSTSPAALAGGHTAVGGTGWRSRLRIAAGEIRSRAVWKCLA